MVVKKYDDGFSSDEDSQNSALSEESKKKKLQAEVDESRSMDITRKLSSLQVLNRDPLSKKTSKESDFHGHAL